MSGYDDIVQQMKDSQQATGTSPYDDAAQQLKQQDRAQAALALGTSIDVNADRAAANRNIAKRYNTTPEAVDKYPDEFRQHMATQLAQQALTQAPVLQSHINQNPQIAPVLHDDVVNTAALEKALSAPQMTAWEGEDAQPTLRERMSDWWRNQFGAPSVAEEKRGQREAEATAILAGRTPGATDDQAWQNSRQAVGGMSQIPQMVAERFTDSATFGLVAPTTGTKPHSWQSSVAGAAGQLGGFIVGPAKGAGMLVNPLEHVAGESFAKALSKDVVNTAGTLALASAAEKAGHAALDTTSTDQAVKIEADALMGGAEMGGIFGAAGRLIPDNDILSTVLRAAGVNTAMDLSQGTSPTDNRPLEDKVFGYMLNTLFSLHGAGRTEGGWLHDATASKVAEQDYSKLQAIGQLSAASKWRERDPEGFKSYIENVTEDGHLENVYVDGKVFAQEMNKAGITPDELQAKMPEVAKQIQEATQTDGMVRIPVADYATHIAGGKLDEVLLQHLKTDPEGKTYAEAQEFYQGQTEQLKEQATKLAEQKQTDDAWQQSQQAVHDDIQQRLDATGRFPPDVSKVYAAMHRDFFSVLADRLGITPEEAYAQHGADVRGEAVAGGHLDQVLPEALPKGMEQGDANKIAAMYRKEDKAKAALLEQADPRLVEDGAKARAYLGTFSHSVDKSALNHILKNHGDEVTEVARGQLPIRDSDIAQIPDIVKSYDGVRFDLLSDSGKPVVAYVKRKADGVLLYMEEAHNKRHDLAALSMRKYPATADARKVLQNASPNVRNDDGHIAIIGKPPEVFKQGEDNRGFYNPEARTIGLLKNADLSTFVHESGHFFLDTYSKIATQPDAPAGIKSDMDAMLKWFGVDSLDKWHSMSLEEQRPYHEQLARGFESYMMEGKAPSLELQPLFSRIRSWMVNVYQSLRNLNVQLTPEVRQVFDRMLASENAIKEAEATRSYTALFTDKPEGVSGTDWQNYQQLGADATQTAIDTMQSKSLKDMRWLSGAKSKAMRELQNEADTQRKAIREEVEKEVDQQPLYRAEQWLRKGETVGKDGELIATSPEARKGAKFNNNDLKEMYPETMLARPDLDGLKGMTSPKGMHPDMVADMFGFHSGDDLVRSLLEAEPRASVVEGLTDRRMLERHGELATPDAVAREAEAAIHNEARARFMATGLKMLTKSPISARQLEKGAKEAADAAIAAKRVRDVRPKQYEAAEAKANKEALKLVAKDPAGAVSAQRSALLNNQLVKSAQQALTDVQKGLDYFKKFDKDSIRENIDVAFRDQIDALLARHDLRTSYTPEQAEVARKMSLEQFVEKLAAMKFSVDVPEKLITNTSPVHYKSMSVEDFRGLVDAVKSIEHMGRAVQKITDGTEQRMLDEVAKEAADNAALLPQRKSETNRGLSMIGEKWLNTKAFGRSLSASLLKVEQMMDWMDARNPLGVYNRMVFRKIAAAEAARNDLDLKITQRVQDYVKALPKDVIKANRGTIEMPGVVDAITGQPQRLTWGEKMSLAAIRGDAQHFSKLLKGEQWDAGAVTDFLDKNMTKEEWGFVKGLADQFQEIHPLKVEMLRSLGSTAPKEVDRIPFQTPHGDMPGWYWPISYDPARSQSVKERNARHGASIFEDNIYSRADTSTGREMTRNDNYAKPMLLSIDTFPRVLKDEIRDITTRKAIVEADRFLSHPDVRRAITGALSEQHYDALNGWLLSLANDAAAKPSELQMWDRIAHEIRTRTTMVGLGFRISTMIMHGTTAAGESVAEAGFKPMANGIFDKRTFAAMTKELGPEWLTKGIESFARSDQWTANRDFISERSAEMRHRANEFERDVREKLRDIDIQLMNPATGKAMRVKLAIESRAYQGIAMLDMASALPTWMGAYLKGIEKEERGGLGYNEQDAIYFADKTVRNAHGGGGIKDMAAAQRGGEWFKLFTMFYTFWNHNINRLMDTARRAKELPANYQNAAATGEWGKFRGDVGTLVLRSFMYTLGVQAVHHMMHPPKEGEEPDTWLVWFAKQMASSAFSGVPLARDVVGHYAGGKDYEVSPIAAAIHSTDMFEKDLDGTAKSDKFIKHSLTEAGYVFGLPLGQAGSTVQFLSDVWDGKQHPQDITEWWHGILHGETKAH